MKHLLKLLDLSKDEILDILRVAEKVKKMKKAGMSHEVLKGKTLGMIFQKSSTRTRVSFEVGIYQLGGQGLFLSSRDLQIGRGEPIEDTARVLSRYLDCIMIRTFDQEEVETLAKYSDIPIINGLTDFAHPCQVLADLQTIKEYKGSFENLKMTYIGDGNNMANSLIVGGLKVGMNVSVCCPAGYEPDPIVLEFAKDYDCFELTSNIEKAFANADVVITDVWASMGQEDESMVRQKAFNGYQINAKNMAFAKEDAMVLHCLPAHREEEISSEMFNKFSAQIFDEAENRLHAQKAVMIRLMGGDF